MSRRKKIMWASPAAVAIVAIAAWLVAGAAGGRVGQFDEAGRAANIYPDYSGVTIPPNIAPLNLQVREPAADRFCLKVSADKGEAVETYSDDGIMRIDQEAWRKLVAANAGGELRLDVFARVPGKPAWTHFETIRSRVETDEIDAYVVYRVLPPIYNMWQDMTLRERAIGSFQERVVFDNRRSIGPDGKSANIACMNCHTFHNHRTDRMLLQARPGGDKSQGPSMLVIEGSRAAKIDTRAGNEPPAAYVSWHPNGRLVAFSRNSLWQMFHTAGIETREVVDRDSDLGIYDTRTGETFAPPAIAKADRLETFPCWSPDGKYLYFCSAPLMWTEKKRPQMELYDKVRYDLVRIAYDAESGKWGQVETVVPAAEIGKSISLPRVSPDGKFMMFCGHDYGSFPPYQPSCDLYMVDLGKIAAAVPATGAGSNPQAESVPLGGAATTSAPAGQAASAPSLAKAVRLDAINSDQADSYHSWSANGRWVIFSSKREDGLFSRLFVTHVDADGLCSKPFMLPQEDPTSNGRLLLNYNLPEMVLEPVKISGGEIARAINSTAARPAAASRPIITGATPRGQASPNDAEPWQAPN